MSGDVDERFRRGQYSLARLMAVVTMVAIVARVAAAVAQLQSPWWIGCVWCIGPPLVAGSLLVVSLAFDSDFDAFVPGAVLAGWFGVLFGVLLGLVDGALVVTLLWTGINCAAFGGAMTACSLGHLRGAAAMVVIGLYFPFSILQFIGWVAVS